MQIKKGDKFRCIKGVVMSGGRHNGEVAYFKGQEYKSEKDGAITDEWGNVEHYWSDDEDLHTHFLKLEEPKEYIEMRGVDPDEEESPKDILREEIRTFETGAVRDSNKGKSRPDLISPYFTNRLGFRLAYGIEKGYGENNWKKGIPNEAFLESLERHLVAYKMGKTDEDHAAAIAFNIMGIIHNEEVAKL
jgi:hypothetical protein